MHAPLFSDNAGYIATNNDILIKQREYNYTCCQWINCCSQLPSDLIRYSYVAPTPILQQRGLTPQVLQQEIEYIEALANECTQNTKNPIIGIFAVLFLIAFIAGNILFFQAINSFEMSITTPMFLEFGGMVGLIVCGAINGRKRNKVVHDALDKIRKYVEIDLNGKYQQTNGIRWSIVEGQKLIITVNRNTGREVGRRSIPYYHIGISCVATNNAPAVIVYAVHDNPNNQQQQQSAQSASLSPAGYGAVQEGDKTLQ